MPSWCALASAGSNGMKNKLPDDSHIHATTEEDEGDVLHPSPRQYVIAIFFIVFGTIGMVAGLLSNIYVQVNNVFFSPH